MVQKRRQSAVPLHVVPVPSAGQLGDAELARGLAEQAAWAQTLAWNRYAALVFRLAHRTLGSIEAAEDLTQDVFFRLFLRAPTIEKHSALRSFIVSITLRLLKWELRRRRVRRWVMLSPTGEPPEAIAPTADPAVRIRLRRFYSILDQLSAEERSLFVLRHVERFTLEEVAEATGLSLATVKRHLARTAARFSALVAHDPELASLTPKEGFLTDSRGGSSAQSDGGSDGH